MNRRKFLTSIFGALAIAPFLSTKEDDPKIIGVDKATPEKDQTFYSMLDIKNRNIIPLEKYAEVDEAPTGLLLFNNVSQDEFETMKKDYIENIKNHRFTIIPNVNHFNCKCNFEWIEIE